MIEKAWLVQSLPLSGGAIEETNGTPPKIVVTVENAFSLATHIFKVEKDPFYKKKFQVISESQ